MSSSLLRTKNSTKLLKKLLQRSGDWQSDAATDDKKTSKKRPRETQEPTLSVQPLSKKEVMQQHIQTILKVDGIMKRPPTSSKNKNKNKKPRLDRAIDFLDREQEHRTSKRQEAKANMVVGAARSSATQSHTVHQPTLTKRLEKEQAKEKKKQQLQKLAARMQLVKKGKKKRSK
jgi:hypothetical protein